MEAILVLASLTVAVATAVAVGAAVLGQVQRAAMQTPHPIQFYLTDFAWLLVQLQVALAIVTRYDFGAGWANRMVLGFFAGALSIMWWGAVRSLSQAGVRGLLRRAAFILLVLPGVEGLMVLGAMSYGLGPIAALNVYRGEVLLPWQRFGEPVRIDELLFWAACGAAAVAATLMVSCAILRWITRWILAEASSASAVAPAAT